MNNIIHQKLDKNHYNKEGDTYDIFNDQNSLTMNNLITNILEKHKVKTILDMTCGTGSQVFHMHNKGFDITGLDFSPKMLEKAQEKARQQGLDVRFILGDIRTSKVGKFNSVISIFNAVGHLTKDDFNIAMRNISENLNEGGIYIFDNFNLGHLLEGDNITKLTIDWQKEKDGKKYREIQYSTINKEGVLASYDIYHKQQESSDKITNGFMTLQIYSKDELSKMLNENGFEVLEIIHIDNYSNLCDDEAERYVFVGRKV